MARGTGDGHATDGIWRLLDGQVASGRLPGYVAAVRIGDASVIRAGGRTAVEPDSPPMAEDTLFRIASVTKPMGGVLTMALVDDGVLGLDDPAARWLPELERPRVLVAPDVALDDTTDAVRPITVRHLLTCTTGWGAIVQPTPLQRAMIDRRVFPERAASPDDRRRVRRDAGRAAARLPTRRGLPLRHPDRRPRRAAGARGRAAAVRAVRRADPRPARA